MDGTDLLRRLRQLLNEDSDSGWLDKQSSYDFLFEAAVEYVDRTACLRGTTLKPGAAAVPSTSRIMGTIHHSISVTPSSGTTAPRRSAAPWPGWPSISAM